MSIDSSFLTADRIFSSRKKNRIIYFFPETFGGILYHFFSSTSVFKSMQLQGKINSIIPKEVLEETDNKI